jgi:hypothetical protein
MNNYSDELQSGPEILEMVVDCELMKRFKITQIKTPWGTDDDLYCLFNETLIGTISRQQKQYDHLYQSLDICYKEAEILELTPMIKSNQYITLPNLEEFVNALTEFLSSCKGWALLCIGDIDEQAVNYINCSPDEVRDHVVNMMNCELNGSDFPTFVIRSDK